MNDERQCKNCRFWLRLAPEDVNGQCRRFPPLVPQTQKQEESLQGTGVGPFVGVWPDTLGVDWCGEFQPQDATPQDRPVAVLRLSTRTLSCLEKANIRTVSDLARRSARDLLGIRNFGDACLREVQQKLKEAGLSLRSG
jgi:DNA-directed RNA polymerase alpha subunit